MTSPDPLHAMPAAWQPALAHSQFLRQLLAARPPVVFFVQAGAYSRLDDAEAQKARLGMSGLAARITEREQSGRTVYRVRVGPFDARDDAEAAQSKLTESGVEANLVRVER